MMKPQILNSLDFTKTQSKYFENKTSFFFFSNKEIHTLHIKGYFIAKNSFVVEVIFRPQFVDTLFIVTNFNECKLIID